MINYLNYLEYWHGSKSKIFAFENWATSVSAISNNAKRSRSLDIESGKLFARATVWESGELDVEAIDREEGFDIVRKTFLVKSEPELDDKLNWWLSEIVIY